MKKNINSNMLRKAFRSQRMALTRCYAQSQGKREKPKTSDFAAETGSEYKKPSSYENRTMRPDDINQYQGPARAMPTYNTNREQDYVSEKISTPEATPKDQFPAGHKAYQASENMEQTRNKEESSNKQKSEEEQQVEDREKKNDVGYT